KHAADQGVVHAKLAALAVHPLLRGARVTVHLAGVAGVGVNQDELSDVVQQGGYEKLVAVLVANLLGEPLGGALGGHGVKTEALRLSVPAWGALEEVEHRGAAGERLDARGAQQ